MCVCVCVYTPVQIFINGQHVGGSDDLAALDTAGQLDDMLQSVPKKQYDPPKPPGLFNIDAAGVKERYIVGSVVFLVAVGVSIGLILGVHNRWWRVFTFLPFVASFATVGQSVTKT